MTPTPAPRPILVTGKQLVAGGLLLSLAAAAPLLAAAPRDTAPRLLHSVSDTRSAPSPTPLALGTAARVGDVARTAPARASRGGARTALAPTRFELRTVPVGRTFTGMASWYGGSFQGRRTANGERFDTQDLTAASRTLPFGTRLRVCRASRCVIVRINDRGPYVSGRVLDLSAAARAGLGFSGVARVTATPVDLRRVPVRPPAPPVRRARPAHSTAVHPAARPSVRPTPGALNAAQASAAGGNLNEVGLALVGASGAGLAWSRRRRS